MVVLSSLALKTIGKNFSAGRSVISSFKNAPKLREVTYVPVRANHNKIPVSKNAALDLVKYKDLVYRYLLIGGVPVSMVLCYNTLFAPEGYDPKNTIARLMAKCATTNPLEALEKSFVGKLARCRSYEDFAELQRENEEELDEISMLQILNYYKMKALFARLFRGRKDEGRKNYLMDHLRNFWISVKN